MPRTQSSNKKAVCLAVSVIMAIALLIGAGIYGSFLPSYASADVESMTNMMDAEQEAKVSAETSDYDNGASPPKDSTNEDSTSAANDEGDKPKDKAAPSSISSGSASNADTKSSSSESAVKSEGDSDRKKASSKTATTTATVYYFEYTNYEDPDAIMVEPGCRYLGQHVIKDLNPGQQLNAWDYVVKIPGHFFYDGWPRDLVVTEDPTQNVIKLFYMKLWNYEYTVNYYMMTGADLTADNWKDALAPKDVKFTKLGSEVFTNQRFDALIKGDAYEYKLDGMYVIDTYPAQIRVGTDSENNVINVLYTPTSTTLPDDLEIPESSSDGSSSDNTPGTLPDDETFNKDDLISLLPDEVEVDTASADTANGPEEGTGSVKDDFVGNDSQLNITDEMLDNPISEEEAGRTLAIYGTGQHSGTLAQTEDALLPTIIALIVVAAIGIAILVIALARRPKRDVRN